MVSGGSRVWQSMAPMQRAQLSWSDNKTFRTESGFQNLELGWGRTPEDFLASETQDGEARAWGLGSLSPKSLSDLGQVSSSPGSVFLSVKDRIELNHLFGSLCTKDPMF